MPKPILDALRTGEVTLHVRVENDEAIRPVWTVIGRINGSAHPDEWVLAGNHRDAWAYGGVDPSSGSAVLMEMARSLGALVKSGARPPKRTIRWRAGTPRNLPMTSSTEWGEQHELELREKAVAYLNVDAAVSGPTFSARAVPSLAGLVRPRPQSPTPRSTRASGPAPTTPSFSNFVGVPIVDMRFEGPYGVPLDVRHARLGGSGRSRLSSPRAADAHLGGADDAARELQISFRSTMCDTAPTHRRLPVGCPTPLGRAARRRVDGPRTLRCGRRSPCRRRCGRGRHRGHRGARSHQSRADGGRTLVHRSRGSHGRPWFRHRSLRARVHVSPRDASPPSRRRWTLAIRGRVAEAERRLADALNRAADALAPSEVEGS